MNKKEFSIFTFYQFKKILNPQELCSLLKEFCQFNKLKGTIIIAREGINGSIGGFSKSTKILEKKLRSLGWSHLNPKFSYCPYMPFYRLKIRFKKEIVTFSNIELDVEKNTAEFVDFKNWNNIIEDKNIMIIDVRNHYESKIGSFNNSIKTNTKNFIHFKKYVQDNLVQLKTKKIAMYCTGGIRCEKASSYMKKIGFKDLYQLKGGILDYLKNIPNKSSKWKGECFIFDNRVSVKNEMKKGSYELCYGCRMPIKLKNKLSSKFEKGVSCEYCFDNLSEQKKRNLRQRNKQIIIAKKRGLYNPYIRYTTSNY